MSYPDHLLGQASRTCGASPPRLRHEPAATARRRHRWPVERTVAVQRSLRFGGRASLRLHGTVAVDGRFTFDNVQAGTYLVSVSDRRGRGTTEVEVPEEGEVEVWIDVSPRDR